MAENNELWIGIDNCPNYEISSAGRVRAIKRFRRAKDGLRAYEGSILKLSPNTSGYLQATVQNKDGRKTTIHIHRIVAKSFIPNPENKSQVNHKKGIKTDNRVSELEWATHQENIDHAVKFGLIKRGGDLSYSKLVLDTSNGVYYDSITEAAISKGLKNRTLHHWLLGDRKNKSSFILV